MEDEFQEDFSNGEQEIPTFEQILEEMRLEKLDLLDGELIEELGLE